MTKAVVFVKGENAVSGGRKMEEEKAKEREQKRKRLEEQRKRQVFREKIGLAGGTVLIVLLILLALAAKGCKGKEQKRLKILLWHLK